MSDPVSSMDVEDVLSSIRRLVSEEAKGTDQPGKPANDIHAAAETAVEDAIAQLSEESPRDDHGPAFGTPPSNDIVLPQAPEAGESTPHVSFRHKSSAVKKSGDQRLVLTAALRVPEPVSDPDAGLLDPAAGRTPPDATMSAQEIPARDAETGSSPETVEPEEMSQPADARTDREPLLVAPSRPAHPHLRTVSDDEAIGPEESGGLADGDDETSGIEQPDAPLDFAPEDTLFERARRAMETAKEASDPLPAYVFEAEHPGNESDRPAPAATTSDFLSGLRASLRVEQPHPQEEEIADASVPETTQTGEDALEGHAEDSAEDNAVATGDEVENAASPFRVSGGAFDEARGDVQEDSETDAGEIEEIEGNEPSTINFTEEDSIIDEETLRDIVSEMVREELQGELGDRITRNVRKLVRREIQRALATREFE